MKNYTITINGNKYAVTVEEGNGSDVAKAAAPAAAPAPAASGAQGAVAINAPVAGKITAINAPAGTKVKKGQCILTLEAMKMENEVVAPQDGTVASINCNVNDHVETGAVIATLN